jgi:DNA-binding Lrp family transcriptional regulator
VSPTPINPSRLDIDMLRELYREGAVNIAGIDPRLNATQIAHRLHVGRRRVAARLKVWKKVGFLRRYDVWLNPALLGVRGGWLNVRVDHPRSKAELFRRLALIDGVVSALDFLGEWVSVGLVGPDDRSIERKMALIRGLAGVREVEGPGSWDAPSPRRTLTPLDLRIVRALRARPEASLSETARTVGVSTRTMTRRYADLVEDWAVWFVPVFDFTALVPPVISLNLTVRRGTSQSSIARALRKNFPLVLESRLMAGLPNSPSEVVLVFVTLPSSASSEELHRLAESLEGVESVEQLTMVRMHSFPEAFDRELDALEGVSARPKLGARRPKPA